MKPRIVDELPRSTRGGGKYKFSEAADLARKNVGKYILVSERPVNAKNRRYSHSISTQIKGGKFHYMQDMDSAVRTVGDKIRVYIWVRPAQGFATEQEALNALVDNKITAEEYRTAVAALTK